jgi:hypothetical protein
MNFLQLCQRACTECGVSSTLSTTVGHIGSLARIVNWVGDAWSELQAERGDWDWMRSSNLLGAGVSFAPVAGQFNTPLGTLGVSADSFGKWDEETFRCFTTANASSGIGTGGIGIGAIGEMEIGVPVTSINNLDEIFLDCIDFDVWRNGYMFGAMRNVNTRPVAIAIGPDQSLNLAPPPNGLYTITGDYWMAPSLMAADTDVPIGLQRRWHMLIVYDAMMKYGEYEAASDVIARAQRERGKLYRQIEALNLPKMGFGGSLA